MDEDHITSLITTDRRWLQHPRRRRDRHSYASQLSDILSCHSLHQHVYSPTHVHGHTLDLLITRDDQSVAVLPVDPPLLSDHAFVVADCSFPLLWPDSAALTGPTCTTHHQASVSEAIGRVVRQPMSRHEENYSSSGASISSAAIGWQSDCLAHAVSGTEKLFQAKFSSYWLSAIDTCRRNPHALWKTVNNLFSHLADFCNVPMVQVLLVMGVL